MNKQGVKGRSFLKTEGNDNNFIQDVSSGWTGAVPYTIVFGKQSGAVVDQWEGEADARRFSGAIEKALIN